MNTRERILIGGVGAMVPSLLNLFAVDMSIILLKITLIVVLGYLIRVTILFFLGGLIGYLHKDEKSIIKLLQLGVAAPAVITALINAGNISVPELQASNPEPAHIAFLLAPPLYAQPVPEPEIKTFSMPKETVTQQLFRGLTGSRGRGVWFVIVGMHENVGEARAQVGEINQKRIFKADVYAPYGSNPCYSVVIGANLTLEEAEELRSTAIKEGFAKEISLWTFPER